MNNPHDLHAQTARELFGEPVTPSTRWLAKNINFMRLYGGSMYNEFTRGYGDAKLLPHQEELIAKAKEMGHRAWPGMPRPNLSDVQMPNTQVGETPELSGEASILDEAYVLGRGIELRIAEHLWRFNIDGTTTGRMEC